MRVRQVIRRVSFSAAGALLALSLVAPVVTQAQEDPDADRPPVWRASAFTAGVGFAFNTKPPAAVAEIINVNAPLGESTFGTGFDSTARAASMWPGLLVAKGANLVWGQMCAGGFPCEQFSGFPPAWPLASESNYPTNVDSEATANGQRGGDPDGPMSMTVHVLETHAGRDHVSSTAIVEDFNFLPIAGEAGAAESPGDGSEVGLVDGARSEADAEAANPSLLHVGSMKSVTREVFDDDTLVAFAETRLADVSLFGGAVQIDKIVARSTSRNDGEAQESDPRVVVEGVTVGGEPATITNRGIVVGDGECPTEVPEVGQVCTTDQGTLSLLSNGLSDLFTNSPTPIRLVETTSDDQESATTGDATGLLIEYEIGTGALTGVSPVGQILVGVASTQSRLSNDAGAGSLDLDLDLDVGGDFGGGDGGAAGDSASVGSGTTGGDFGGDDFVAADAFDSGGGRSPGAPVGSSPGEPQAQAYALELLSGVAAQRMKLFYGAWVLALMGLALGSRPGLRFGLSR